MSYNLPIYKLFVVLYMYSKNNNTIYRILNKILFRCLYCVIINNCVKNNVVI